MELPTKKQIYEIYSKSYTIKGLRGKERQKIINRNTIDILMLDDKYKDCSFKEEERLYEVSWGKYFAVDISIYKDNELIEIVLVKAPASNIGQNKQNSLNSKFGEVGRLSDYFKKGVKLTFFNFLPNISPYFYKNEDIKDFQNNKVEGIERAKDILKECVDFRQIFVTFNISNIKDCKNKNDVKNLISSEMIFDNIDMKIL